MTTSFGCMDDAAIAALFAAAAAAAAAVLGVAAAAFEFCNIFCLAWIVVGFKAIQMIACLLLR